MQELPTIAKSAYGTTTSAMMASDLMLGNVQAQGWVNPGTPLLDQEAVRRLQRKHGADRAYEEDVKMSGFGGAALNTLIQKAPMPTSRIVRIFIADTNDSVPLDKRLIYKSEEKHTDLTDQELFFEANPAQLLADYNAFRVTVVDKKTLGTQNVRNLEPARIRDLKMVVVDVAAF